MISQNHVNTLIETAESRKRKLAFTLAEVLITLLIIGVVSSLVIPALINNTQEAEYNTGLKKVQSELSNAIKMIQVNNGGSVHAGDNDDSGLRNDFCSVMVCAKTGSEANIFNSTTYKYYKATGSYRAFDIITNRAAVLNDGTLISFGSYANCLNWGVNACGVIYADINGLKGPNMVGKDLFIFYPTRQNGNGIYSIVPAGIQGDTHAPSSTSCIVGNGYGCTAVRLTNPDAMP